MINYSKIFFLRNFFYSSASLTHLFLYNYSTKRLHGVFEATAPGALNIDPAAWRDAKAARHNASRSERRRGMRSRACGFERAPEVERAGVEAVVVVVVARVMADAVHRRVGRRAPVAQADEQALEPIISAVLRYDRRRLLFSLVKIR